MSDSFSSQFLATLRTYATCGAKASRALARNWPIPAGGFLLYFLFILTAPFFTPFGMVGGMMIALIATAAISVFYGWLEEAIGGRTLKWSDYAEFDTARFWAFVSVSFILWIVPWFLQNLLAGLDAELAIRFVRVAIVFMFNALPETVYLRRYERLYAFKAALEFTQKNWIEWYGPFLLISLPWLISGSVTLTQLLESTDVLLPVGMLLALPAQLFPQIPRVPLIVLGVVAASWFLLFRGFLFLELESGSRRARAFREKFRS